MDSYILVAIQRKQEKKSMISRKQFWLTALMSSFVMALIMSGVLSGYKLGFNAQWPQIWLNGFTIAWRWRCCLTLPFCHKSAI